VVRQNEDIVAIDAKLVGWGNGVRYGRGTNAAHYSRAGHECGAASAFALFCSGQDMSTAAKKYQPAHNSGTPPFRRK
jgi:hypothetical protein